MLRHDHPHTFHFPINDHHNAFPQDQRVYSAAQSPFGTLAPVIRIVGETRTMSKVSHNVPDPLRNTSSGFRGIMLHNEKMNGWTYFMYR